MALVTIGIPVFNEGTHLRATIESALAQSFSDLEIIICDNHSTDDSFKIAKEFADTESRIKLIRHSSNKGAQANFRECLNQAKSKYFAWLGGHDVFSPDYIELAVTHFQGHPKAVMVYPKNAVFIDAENQVIRSGACSDIETPDVHSPVDRMIRVVRNLCYCTNIHGLFLTKVLRQLPFETVIGPDFLQLSLTALFGEIHALEAEGIRRREVIKETALEKTIRWKKLGIFEDSWHDPHVLLVLKHISNVIKSKQIGIIEKTKLCILLPKVFNDSEMVKWRRYFYL